MDREIIVNILQQAVSRADNLELKGKKRDTMVLEFALGACSALQHTKNEKLSNWLLRICTVSLAIRGAYREAVDFINTKTEKDDD